MTNFHSFGVNRGKIHFYLTPKPLESYVIETSIHWVRFSIIQVECKNSMIFWRGYPTSWILTVVTNNNTSFNFSLFITFTKKNTSFQWLSINNKCLGRLLFIVHLCGYRHEITRVATHTSCTSATDRLAVHRWLFRGQSRCCHLGVGRTAVRIVKTR